MLKKITGSILTIMLMTTMFLGAIGVAKPEPVYAAGGGIKVTATYGGTTYTIVSDASINDEITFATLKSKITAGNMSQQKSIYSVDGSALTKKDHTTLKIASTGTGSINFSEDNPPKSPGISVSFQVTQSHTHIWNNNSYSADGNVITATCQGSGTCPLTKPTLTLNASGKTYDGSQVTASLTKSSTWSSQGLATPTINYSPANSKNVGTYTASATVGNATATQQFTISPKTLTLSWGNNTFTYDGNSHAPTASISGVVSGDTCNVSVSGAKTNAGSYTATASIDNNNYALPSSNTKDFTINKKPLTLTGVTANSKEYDGTDEAVLEGTAALTGVVEGDVVQVDKVSGVYTDGKAVGDNKEVKVTATLSGKDAANYEVTPLYQNADITAKEVTVPSGITASDKTYDGNESATLDYSKANIEGKIDDDNLGVSTTGTFSDKNAGENKTVTFGTLTLTGGDAGNYKLADSGNQTETTATINKKALKVSGITAANKTYDAKTDATVDASGAEYEGKVGTDDVKVDTGSAKGNFADKNVGPDKPVAVTFDLTGNDKDNYTASVDGEIKANIIAKSVKVSGITVDTRQYDKTTDAPLNTKSAQFDGIENGDTLTVSGKGTFTDSADVGEDKPVSVTYLTLGGTDKDNYTVSEESQSTAEGTVTKRDIKVSGITASDKTYDGKTDATLVFTGVQLGGNLDEDDLQLVDSHFTGAFDNKNAGTGKTVNISISEPDKALSGTAAGNYKLADKGQQTTTKANIGQLAIVVSNIKAKDKTYDGNTDAELDYKDAVLKGKLDNDKLTVSATGKFSDKNVEQGKTVTISGITLEGDDAGNYVLASEGQQESATASITKRPVKVSGITADDKVYDGNTTATVKTEDAEFENIVSGDTLTVSTTGTFDTKNVGEGKTVTIGNLILGGESVNNYELASTGQQSTTEADITPKQVNVKAKAATKDYGDDDPAFEYTADSLLDDDKYTGSLSREAGEDVGTYEIQQGKLTAGDNYKINYTPADFTITQADNSVTASIEGWTYGDEPNDPSAKANFGDKTATFTYSNAADGEYTDTVPTDAGTWYVKATIAETPNYKGAVSKPFEFEIEKKVVELDWTDTELTYNGEAQKPKATATGLVGQDECEVTVDGEQKDANAKTGTENYTAEATDLDNPNYKLPDNKTTTFTIAPKPITQDMLSVDNDMIKHDGSEQGPKVSMKDGDLSHDMIDDEDYTLSGDVKSSKKGTHVITITGKGNYTDSIETSWVMYGDKQNSDKEEGVDGAGDIEIFVDVDNRISTLKVNNFTIELAKGLLTDEDMARYKNGENVLVYMLLKEQTKGETGAGDRYILGQLFRSKGATDIAWYDITVWKKIGNSAATKVHNTVQELSMSVEVPDIYKAAPEGYTREFYFGRSHDGAATVLAQTSSVKIGFSSSKFSTYALALKDTKIPEDDSDSDADDGSGSGSGSGSSSSKSGANTGDANNMTELILLMLASSGLLGAIGYRRRRETDK